MSVTGVEPTTLAPSAHEVAPQPRPHRPRNRRRQPERRDAGGDPHEAPPPVPRRPESPGHPRVRERRDERIAIARIVHADTPVMSPMCAGCPA